MAKMGRRFEIVILSLAVVGLMGFLFLRIFMFQTFSTPSAAMMPTLLVGDIFVASKYAYGYGRYSIPGLSLSGRILAADPKRGDVVVFRAPKDAAITYVKRVVGLPGERIQMINGVLNINGVPIKRERIDDFIDTEKGGQTRIRRWREILPNGVSYATLDLQDNGPLDNTQIFEVPPEHYFVLGDNLDNSTDSRILASFGYVPAENILGRAEFILLSFGPGSAALRLDRFGKPVR